MFSSLLYHQHGNILLKAKLQTTNSFANMSDYDSLWSNVIKIFPILDGKVCDNDTA